MKFLTLLIFFVCPAIVFAQDGSPELAAIPSEVQLFMTAIGPYLTQAIIDYPILAKMIAVLGGARVFLKPLMSIVWSILNLTPKSSDNEKYKKLTSGKIFSIFAYVLDYAASVKAKNPKE